MKSKSFYMLCKTKFLPLTCALSLLVSGGMSLAEAGQTSSAASNRGTSVGSDPSIGSDQIRIVQRAGKTIVETPNFRIRGFTRQAEMVRWAREFESMRTAICQRWLGGNRSSDWSPKCELVLHATSDGYLREVGGDHAATVGASRVDVCGCRIVQRRIDIRADRPGWLSGALAHELTHVVLADEFVGGELPLWADEGMAVLADPEVKQSLHLRDLREADRRDSLRRLAALFADPGAPRREQMPAFYGQSFSLVKFLVDRKTPADFVRFLHLAEKTGYDAALRDCYGLRGVADLERQWRQSTLAARPRGQLAAPQARRSRNAATAWPVRAAALMLS